MARCEDAYYDCIDSGGAFCFGDLLGCVRKAMIEGAGLATAESEAAWARAQVMAHQAEIEDLERAITDAGPAARDDPVLRQRLNALVGATLLAMEQ